MFELLLLGKADGGKKLPHPVGQVSYNSQGTYNWTVPEGVTTIHVACLGPGAQTPLATSMPYPPGTAGGGLMYMNKIKVSPGQIIRLVVGAPGWTNAETSYTDTTFTQFQAMAVSFYDRKNQPAGANWFGGGSGGEKQPSGRWYLGGSAASLIGWGSTGHVTIDAFISEARIPGGWDKDLTVYTQPSPSTPRGLYGVGATINQYAQYAYPARPGIVRIIWGDGRSFPNSKIDNQPVLTMADILAGA